MSEELVPYETIESHIYFIRGQKVMFDRDLAALYGVSTKVLNQATKRNIERFPEDFMFQLSHDEWGNLKSQIARSNLKSQIVTSRWGGIRKLPFAFTEHGILMLSSVLNSPKAIYVNIAIMRAFVRLRQMIANNAELAKKIGLLEKRVFKHDSDIRQLVRDIRRLTVDRSVKRKQIGFKV